MNVENRILIIADEVFGNEGESVLRAKEILLCKHPNRPMQFTLNAPTVSSLNELTHHVSADIIGKKAGRIVFALGLKDLKRARGNIAKVLEDYRTFIELVLIKTQVPLFLVTIPVDFLPEENDHVAQLNESIKSLAVHYPKRIQIIDYDFEVQRFKEKQMERGKFARSLFSESAEPTSLCLMLAALLLEDCILKSEIF